MPTFTFGTPDAIRPTVCIMYSSTCNDSIQQNMKTSIYSKILALPLVIGSLAYAGSARAQCDLLPIALSANTLDNVQPGAEVRDILNGANRNNFGWLTWTGDESDKALVASLVPGGDSELYVNPLDPTDNVIQVGDWVESKPGPADTRAVRKALDVLETTVITVPVWDVSERVKGHIYYHISGFANVQITGYRLFRQNRISALYLGYTTCGGVIGS